MKSERKIIFVGGATIFPSKEELYEYLRNEPYDPFAVPEKKWRDWLTKELEDDTDFIQMMRPNSFAADYEAWKIVFEKILPYVSEGELVLVGHSMGAIFYLKYLSENDFPRDVNQLHLVAPALDDEGIVGEIIGNFAPDLSLIPKITNKVESVYIYHSDDDEIVPMGHSDRSSQLLPNAQYHKLTGRGHAIGKTFPELLKNIQKTY